MGHGWGFDHLTCPKGKVIDHWCCQIPTHAVPQGGIVGKQLIGALQFPPSWRVNRR